MDEIEYLTIIENLTENLSNTSGLRTHFTPGANIPNDKNLLELDPANYFENSNKTHFYGFSDNTWQPERYYQGEYTPARVVSYEPGEGAFFIDPSSGERYFFISERAGYGTVNFDGSRVPKLFKFQGLTFEDQISLQIPQLKPLTVGANNYVFSETDDYLGFVSSNTDTGNDLGGDLLLLEVINGQIIDRTSDLPPTLSAELYGYSSAVNVHGMGVGDLTGNDRSDIILGDIDVGIYSILQADDGSWSIYHPDVFSLFMYETDRDNLEENFEYRVTQIELIDINNDGYDDIFISFGTPGNMNPAPSKPDVIYINQGEGVFSIEDRIELSLPSYGLDLFETIDAEVIDINEDGFDDLFLFSTKNEPYYSGFQVQIQINKDGTGFEDQTIDRLNLLRDRSISEKWNDYSYNFQYLDLNDDGHLDILNFDRNYLDSAPNDDPGKLQVFLNDGEGYFTEVYVQEHWASENAENPYSTNQPFQIIAANDFDDNGTIDFVTWHKSLAGGLDAEVVWYALSSFVDPIYTGPSQIDVASIAPGYNELFYLRSNPDVKALVEQGTYQTGLHHYLVIGESEGRKIFAPNTKVQTGDEGWDITLSYGNETAIGGEGNDKFYGLSGNDILVGAIGDDVLEGGSGNDQLDGGAGSDTLTGGAGDDTLNGGGGNDTIVYAKGDGNDTIIDFVAGTDNLEYQDFTDQEKSSFVESITDSGDTLITLSDGATIILKKPTQDIGILFGSEADTKTSVPDQTLVFKSGTDTTLSLSSGKLESLSEDFSFTHVEFASQSYDHGIAISDVVLQLRDIVGLSTLSGNQKTAADIDGDGDVAISDVVSNLRHIVGLDTIEQCALVDTSDQLVTNLTTSTIADITLIQLGDVDLSATFAEI